MEGFLPGHGQPVIWLHPQTNGHMDWANQDLVFGLHSWNVTLLPWIEYAHNSLVNSSTDMSPFMASLGFQPPLFPTQEEEVSVPPLQANLHRCHNQRLADRYCPRRLSTSLDRKFGSPPETSPCKLNPVSWTYWTLDTLDLLRSRKLSTHLLSG